MAVYPREVFDLPFERSEEWMERLVGIFGYKLRDVHRFDVVENVRAHDGLLMCLKLIRLVCLHPRIRIDLQPDIRNNCLV